MGRLCSALKFSFRFALSYWVLTLIHYWFYVPQHLFSWVWLIDEFKIREERFAKNFVDKLPLNYPHSVAVAVRSVTILVVWFVVKRRKLIVPTSLTNIVARVFYIHLLFFVLRLPMFFLTRTHWQVYWHHNLYDLFVLLALTTIWSAQPGPRLIRLRHETKKQE